MRSEITEEDGVETVVEGARCLVEHAIFPFPLPFFVFFFSHTIDCADEKDINSAIDDLSSKGEEAHRAYEALLKNGQETPACRKEIVDALTRALSRPHLDLALDPQSFSLWYNGSSLLSELKAVEALDLLIDNLHANDGYFSASIAHQPVIRAVEAMGGLAVPKLVVAAK